jgi:general stress protein YciG
MAEQHHTGNPGNFAEDRERAAAAGRKGRSALTVTNKPEGQVEQRINSARDSLPGRRNGLPEGALTRPRAVPHGDENRDPPPNAPTIPK